MPADKLLTGKTALVTGGGSGIGRATALALARQGADVLVSDVHLDAAEQTVHEILLEGVTESKVQANKTDVSSEMEVRDMVQAAVDAFGKLDCAVNSAGISDAPFAFVDLTFQSWEKMLDIALTGTFLCMKHELQAMLKEAPKQNSRTKSLVNISSGAGLTPAPGQPHYTAAKHGVLGLTKCAAREYAAQGIRVNAICPGMTDTPMLQEHFEQAPEMRDLVTSIAPSGRLALPEEMADTAVWLCSEQSSYVSGESIIVDYAGLCR